MTRVLPYSKVLIVIIACFALFVKRDYHTYTMISNGYAIPFSVNPEEPVSLYFNTARYNKKATFRLYDIKGNKVDSLNAESNVFDTIPKSYVNGFGYPLTAKYNVAKLQSGMYFWDYLVPFIVKKQKSKDRYPLSSLQQSCYLRVRRKEFL